ncbi:MAG: hypothetical protein A3F54_00335 [Candidatus Kerfeldbacteria bacterium RIFCSPHIGHO2_12_FULL_48_17]|uniref:PIN domain-containing protein n=1 Tax=Candidatus Kerfeldbacteria bacterium RIFCSPHIGHO2_12_FULL_48_17 TaxID=1798542 RepID=A0A1G2B8L5_9BACT|nr:MAG: hypothetical protein A3F54_00335 [Candidatus Kerfeldbacteria bacterium RIFCSPHIGHO2_12_FULL_48_17]
MLFDTNILITYLNGDPEINTAINQLIQNRRALFISSISTAEILSLPSLQPKDIDDIKKFLKNFISIPLNDPIAEAAAFLRRIYPKFSLPDLMIAGTAYFHNMQIVTRDKQMHKIREITCVHTTPKL